MILYLYKSVCDFIRCIGKWLQIHQADSKSLDHFSYRTSVIVVLIVNVMIAIKF